MEKFRYGLVLVCFAVTMLVLVGTVSADTWYVDDDGGVGINFTKIQDAVDAAQDNDTIYVYDGTYDEQVRVNKRLTLKGIECPVVDTGGIRISADGCVIEGFNVTGMGGTGIYVYSDYNIIVNNSIYDNEADGIELEGSDYNTIKNNLVFNNSDDGIDLDDSEYNTIANNTVFNISDNGMDIEHSFNNTLINNTVCLNTESGIKLKNSSNNNIRNNNVHTNGGAGIYLCLSWGAEPVDVGSSYNIITSNIIYSNDWAGIELKENSSNNPIYNNNVFNNSNGIDLDFSFNNTLKNNTVTANRYNGICFDDSDGNTISNNSVFDNHGDGIDLEGSFDNMLINNTVYLHTDKGIKLKNSSNNNIRNNIIYSNGDAGIHLCRPWGAEPTVKGSAYNTITSNIIYSNDGCGIILKENSSNNHIYHNNLIYNDEQAYDDSSNNTWDNGPIIGGNYWGDHECTGNPSNGSQPYYIDSDSTDHYPFGDPIGELPPLPPPVPRTDVYVDKTETLYTSDTYINYNQTYNFDIEWYAGVWGTKNLDNVTITLTTLIDIAYIGTWALYNNGSDTSFILPFNHTGENYTWVLPLKDRFASDIDFYLPNKTVQDNPWADMVVNTMDEEGYTRVNVTVIPRTPSLSVDLTINGKNIDFSYPSEFEVSEFFPDYYITFYGEWEDLNQDQSYNFSVLVDEPKEVGLWLDKTHGQWDMEYSNTVTLPVSELGSVTVSYDIPVKWEHVVTQPQYPQSITIALEAGKSFDTGPGTYPSISGIHNGTITSTKTITVQTLYTYSCAGTGGHPEYAKIYNDTWHTESPQWRGYQEDGNNIYFNHSFTLVANETYNYTIRTGSYPQIHHAPALLTDNGWLNCTEFTDANGKKHTDWIPAIRLF